MTSIFTTNNLDSDKFQGNTINHRYGAYSFMAEESETIYREIAPKMLSSCGDLVKNFIQARSQAAIEELTRLYLHSLEVEQPLRRLSIPKIGIVEFYGSSISLFGLGIIGPECLTYKGHVCTTRKHDELLDTIGLSYKGHVYTTREDACVTMRLDPNNHYKLFWVSDTQKPNLKDLIEAANKIALLEIEESTWFFDNIGEGKIECSILAKAFLGMKALGYEKYIPVESVTELYPESVIAAISCVTGIVTGDLWSIFESYHPVYYPESEVLEELYNFDRFEIEIGEVKW